MGLQPTQGDEKRRGRIIEWVVAASFSTVRTQIFYFASLLLAGPALSVGTHPVLTIIGG
jgi:hypothetical protein